jgi:hypothetical protein
MQYSDPVMAEVDTYRPYLKTKLALLPSIWFRWLPGLPVRDSRRLLFFREEEALL